jgi:hypothetical protein
MVTIKTYPAPSDILGLYHYYFGLEHCNFVIVIHKYDPVSALTMNNSPQKKLIQGPVAREEAAGP